MPVLRCRSLSLWDRSQRLLHDIALDVLPGHITALVGPSNSGKSSLLRCFNRLHDSSPRLRMQGEVSLGDANLRAMPLAMVRRRVGMVLAEPSAFPMSIHDNLAFGLRAHGVRGPTETAARIERALHDVGLWEAVSERLDDPAQRLSAEQRLRLALARVLALEPEVLLFDAPAALLESAARLRFEELIHAMAERCGVLVATHDIAQAARVADALAFLHEGRLIEVGPTQTLLTNPRERLTEEYLSGRLG